MASSQNNLIWFCDMHHLMMAFAASLVALSSWFLMDDWHCWITSSAADRTASMRFVKTFDLRLGKPPQ
jgi:hypothetical protein